jgi:hypothetical protein
LLPRKRATACTSPVKRVRSVLGPARYQVTSTPWHTCYSILAEFYENSKNVKVY